MMADTDVAHILAAATHLDVFGLSSYRTGPQELRRLYLKYLGFDTFELLPISTAILTRLCLRVHPDKNSSERAPQAFLRLSTAYDHVSARLQPPKPPQASRVGEPATAPPAKKAKSWWQGKTLRQIEQHVQQELIEFQAELDCAKLRRQQQRDRRKAKRAANADRVKAGLSHLYAKYGLDE
eukprot:m.21772 g.21772  ORF g.21772 m.21772 type:complete len:181 (+) comp11158_c0_seq2:139-681(+)